ncbi:hypothetical protein [Powai lake megavirus]|uniref:Uncharacterized protein n=1 Tax=Powai lake megavirus TaxID=1842663 RepID=A0A167R3N3_9VIRU|nr:hypothetical protein QJ849_gp114 [Powai lake megavirus]ANB50276.1 hypothetical protein [Powai lake megavirus]
MSCSRSRISNKTTSSEISVPNRQVSSRICNQLTNSIDSIISTPIGLSNNNFNNELSDYDEKYSRDIYKKKCKEYKQIIDNLKFQILQKEIEMKDMEIKYLKSQLGTESKIFEPMRRYGTRHVTNNVDSTPINEIYS